MNKVSKTVGGLGLVGFSAVGVYTFGIQPSPPQYPKKRAKLQCSCGKTELQFRNSQPLFKIQCCCFDCRQRWEWSRSKGCPLEKYSRPGEGVYVGNAISAVKNEDALVPYMLRKNADVTFLTAECCFSIMLAVHPFYLGNVCGISGEGGCTLEAGDVPCKIRIQIQDWEKSKVGDHGASSLPPWTGDGVECKGAKFSFDYLRMLYHLVLCGLPLVFLTKPWREPGDITAQELVGRRPVKVLGIKEYCHVHSSDGV
jgi:hypothetical protein